MQPQQPYNNPYDFIVNPEKPARKPMVSLSGPGSGIGMRIAIATVIFVLIIIAATVVASLFKGSGNSTNMTSVAQDQAELIRVTTLATQDQSNDISTQTTLYFAQNCDLSVSSEQQRLLAFLSKNGLKLSTAKLALKTNGQTTSALTNAAASSTYDTVFLNAMQGDMNTYIADIKTAYNASKSPTEKQILNTDYQDATLLNQQLKSAINNVGTGT
jgi:hypothetical protein